jgi:hypothetical protein
MEGCDGDQFAAIAVLREGVRRAASAVDLNQAIPIPRFQLDPPTRDARVNHRVGEPWWLAERSDAAPLRI